MVLGGAIQRVHNAGHSRLHSANGWQAPLSSPHSVYVLLLLLLLLGRVDAESLCLRLFGVGSNVPTHPRVIDVAAAASQRREASAEQHNPGGSTGVDDPAAVLAPPAA